MALRAQYTAHWREGWTAPGAEAHAKHSQSTTIFRKKERSTDQTKPDICKTTLSPLKANIFFTIVSFLLPKHDHKMYFAVNDYIYFGKIKD